jgi:hypothetical protein
VLDGIIDPGRVFDRTVGLDGAPDGYRAGIAEGADQTLADLLFANLR